MRISDWSSDVCSSDLLAKLLLRLLARGRVHHDDEESAHRLAFGQALGALGKIRNEGSLDEPPAAAREHQRFLDRKSVVKGTSVSVRVDLGGRRRIKTTTYCDKSSAHNEAATST